VSDSKVRLAGMGQDTKSKHQLKVEQRQDDLYASIRVMGLDRLRRLRELNPGSSPYEILKLIELDFAEAYVSADNNVEKIDAIEELVATSLALRSSESITLEERRAAIELIELKAVQLRLKKYGGWALRGIFVGGGLALQFFDGAKGSGRAKAAKGTKLAKAVQNPNVRKGAGIVLGVGEEAARKAVASGADKRALEQARTIAKDLRKRIGSVPETWTKG